MTITNGEFYKCTIHEVIWNFPGECYKCREDSYLTGKMDILKELIKIWKSRDPLEPFTTNAILLELEVRLRLLENNK